MPLWQRRVPEKRNFGNVPAEASGKASKPKPVFMSPAQNQRQVCNGLNLSCYDQRGYLGGMVLACAPTVCFSVFTHFTQTAQPPYTLQRVGRHMLVTGAFRNGWRLRGAGAGAGVGGAHHRDLEVHCS